MPRSKGTSRKGKPKKAERAAGMGRALQKAQYKKFKPKSNGSSSGAGMASSGAANIGMDNPGQEKTDNMSSVLETNDLTDFLARAELADREFDCEKEQFVVLDANAQQVVFDSQAEGGEEEEDDDARFDYSELSIPKRPKWDETTTPEELDRNEKEAFLTWRRSIARHEETVYATATNSGLKITATPFEKNLEVWRQLWRVLERSDCIVMVVDGRNPLFYVSMDLRRHVVEELGKSMVVVVNKCDYLTMEQRRRWSGHLRELGLEHMFFSAVVEQEILDAGNGIEVVTEVKEEDKEGFAGNNATAEKEQTTSSTDAKTLLDPKSIGIESPLTRTQLLQILTKYTRLHQTTPTDTTTTTTPTRPPRIEIGMVGFPNVGKSSVLNVLVGASRHDHASNRVGVASQPGKTRHFQTLLVPDRPDVTLCDCPGLVFPSFVSSAADLIVAGVFPLNRVRDFWPAVELVVKRIPRVVLEAFYGIELPRASRLDAMVRGGGGSGVEEDGRAPTAEELLTTYCLARSLLAPSSGVPDHHRAARVVLSDYVTGKLLFCHAPPQPEEGLGAGGDGWEASFRRETISTALARATKLRNKLAVVSMLAASGDDGGVSNTLDINGESLPSASPNRLPNLDEEDDDMLDFIGGNTTAADQEKRMIGGNRGKKHKTMQKWGKKGRKNRNKDPYGCHTEPDEELLGPATGAGLCVNAGKYGSSAYTRPDYAGAKGAVSFRKAKGVAR